MEPTETKIAREFFEWVERYSTLKKAWETAEKVRQAEGDESCPWAVVRDFAEKHLRLLILRGYGPYETGEDGKRSEQ